MRSGRTGKAALLSAALFLSLTFTFAPAFGDELHDKEVRYLQTSEQTLMAPSDPVKALARAEAARDLISALLPKNAFVKDEAYNKARSVYVETWKSTSIFADKEIAVARALAAMTDTFNGETASLKDKAILLSYQESLLASHPRDLDITLAAGRTTLQTLWISRSPNFGSRNQEKIDARNLYEKCLEILSLIDWLHPDGVRELHERKASIFSLIISDYSQSYSDTEGNVGDFLSLYQSIVDLTRRYPGDDVFLCARLGAVGGLVGIFLSDHSPYQDTPMRAVAVAQAYAEFQEILQRPVPNADGVVRRIHILNSLNNTSMGGVSGKAVDRDKAEYAYGEAKHIAAPYLENDRVVKVLLYATESFAEKLLEDHAPPFKKDIKRAKEVIADLEAIKATTPENEKRKATALDDSLASKLVIALLEEEEISLAEAGYKKIKEKNGPEKTFNLAKNMGLFFLKRGDVDRSKKYYNDYKEFGIKSDYHLGLFSYGIRSFIEGYEKLGKMDEKKKIIDDLQELARKNPDNERIAEILQRVTKE